MASKHRGCNFRVIPAQKGAGYFWGDFEMWMQRITTRTLPHGLPVFPCELFCWVSIESS
jgi:hypothetical protein